MARFLDKATENSQETKTGYPFHDIKRHFVWENAKNLLPYGVGSFGEAARWKTLRYRLLQHNPPVRSVVMREISKTISRKRKENKWLRPVGSARQTDRREREEPDVHPT